MVAQTTKIDLGREYAAGVNMPAGAGDALKVARADSAGTNLEYVTGATAVAADDTLATALAPFIVESGDNISESPTGNLVYRPVPGVLTLVDDFVSGSTSSALPWALAGVGTPVRAVSFGGGLQPGVHSLTTSAATSDEAYLHMGRYQLGALKSTTFVAQLQSTASCQVFCGVNRTAGSTLGTSGYRFRYDSSVSANWLLETRNASVSTTFDSSIAADTAFVELTITPVGASVQFYIDRALAGIISTNVPNDGSGLHSHTLGIQTLTTATKALKVDYFSTVFETGDRT